MTITLEKTTTLLRPARPVLPETKQVHRPAGGRLRWLRSPWLTRVLLGLFAAAEAIHATWMSVVTSPFIDEGLYIYMGHRILQTTGDGSEIIEHPGAFFSGAPAVYPPLAALADDIGGLQAARALSLIFVLAAGLCVYALAKELYGRLAGLIANVFFLSNSSVMFQAHLATFDAMMMFLVALSAYLGVRSALRNHLTYGLVVSLILTAACFTKYAGIVYVPVIAVLCAAAGWSRWRWIVVRRAGYMVIATLILCYAWLEFFALDDLAGVKLTTFSRSPLNYSTVSGLADSGMLWAGVWLVAAAVSVFFVRRKDLAVALILLLGAVIAPLGQMRIHEATSFGKHLAFGMVFAAPLVGNLLAKILRTTKFKALPTVVAFLAMLIVVGATTSGQFLTGWVDDRPLIKPLETAIAANPTKVVLSEEGASERYELRNILQPRQWADTYSFGYDHKSGMPAYIEAISQSHFGVISLSLTTDYGKQIFNYLISHATPYILGPKVPRYLRGQLIGSWLIFVPRADG